MNLLGAKLYDPGTAATKACTANIAMTAFDTTNLRLTVTVPAHGFLLVRMSCQVEGAATYPQILLGVMEGATVRGRVVPDTATIGGTALATTRMSLCTTFVVPGLTPGSITLDAAYGVEFLVAASNIKYGGPDDTTASNAWGAFVFEIWDPRPLPTAAPAAINGLLTAPTTANVGTSDMVRILGTTVVTPATAGVLDINVKNIDNDAASASGTVTFPNATLASTTNITAGTLTTVTTATNVTTVNGLAAGVITAASIAADAITDAKVASDVTIASVTGSVGSVTGSVGSVTGAVGSVTGAVGSVTGNVGGNVTGSVGSIATGGIAATSFAAGAINAAAIATNAIDADAIAADAVTEIQTGLATSTALATVQADTDNIQTRLPAALVGGKMDSTATVTGTVDANLIQINGLATNGNNATLYLRQLNVQNTSGTAAVFNGGANASGMVINSGDGVSPAAALLVAAQGAATGAGIQVLGAGNSPAVQFLGGSDGHGLELQGGASSGNGLHIESFGGDHAIRVIPDADGDGLRIENSGDGNGINILASGTGSGIRSVGGDTGHGMELSGGATSGDGLHLEAPGTGLPLEPPVSATVTGTVDANLIQIDGLATATQAAVLGLQALNIYNPSGAAISAISDSGAGLDLFGGGGFPGMRSTSANSSGILAEGSSSFPGLLCVGGPDGNGIEATGVGTGSGIKSIGGDTGHGMHLQGGATSGDGLHSEAQSDSNGINAIGAGSSAGIKSVGGDSGHGMRVLGGATSGQGFHAEAQAVGSLDISGPNNDLGTGILDLVDSIEAGLTVREALRIIAASVAGKLSGAGTGTIVIRNAVIDNKSRITATVTPDGDRTAITYDLS